MILLFFFKNSMNNKLFSTKKLYQSRSSYLISFDQYYEKLLYRMLFIVQLNQSDFYFKLDSLLNQYLSIQVKFEAQKFQL